MLPFSIFFLLHFSILIAAIIENLHNVYFLIILSVISLLLGVFYRTKYKDAKARFYRIDIILVFLTALGALITYWLNIELGIGAVLAAGITGLLSSFLPLMNRRSNLLRELPVAMYCGAFAGMTAPFIAKGYVFILFAGLISGIILIATKDTLHGYGGKLGTIAFGGVSAVVLILYLLS
jgi:hypothetical protein